MGLSFPNWDLRSNAVKCQETHQTNSPSVDLAACSTSKTQGKDTRHLS